MKAPPGTGTPWLLDLRRAVRTRLRAQGATQAGLAWHLDVTPEYVSHFLTGATDGTPEMAGRIAAAVGLRITLTDVDGPVPVLPRRRPGSGRRPGMRNETATRTET